VEGGNTQRQGVIMQLRVVFPTSGGGCEYPPPSVIIHLGVVMCTSGGLEYPPQGVIMHLRVVFPASGECEYPPQGVTIHLRVVFFISVGGNTHPRV